MSSNNKGNPISEIKYECTYVEEPDTVTLLSTIMLKNPQKPVSIIVENGHLKYTSNVDLIFVKTKGKQFQYRIKSEIPFDIFCQLYNSASPFTITYNFEQNGKPINYRFGYNEKKWKDNKLKMAEILNIIKLNTGRI